MKQHGRFRRWGLGVAVCAGAAICADAARAQQLIGYVKADDANVTGATDVLDGQAVLSGSVGVTAKDHAAVITLGRGGLARVCQTSSLHMTEGKETAAGSKAGNAATASSSAAAGAAAPLLFSLDRGAVEIRMNGLANDSIMTPDLRMTVQASGPLDVQLRVARNGDTCVENRGAAAPSLAVSDPFGESMYELMPGQHVLFEHGDLHEVVDHETEPCGCPDAAGATVAAALLAPGGQKIGAKTATVEMHPFPAALSEGLTAAPAQAEANPAQPQVTAALVYNANTTNADTTADNANTTPHAATDALPAGTITGMPSTATPASPGSTAPEQEPAGRPANTGQPPGASPSHNLAHTLGRFFRRIFGH